MLQTWVGVGQRAVLLGVWRWAALLATLFHALVVIANAIVVSGGNDVTGVVRLPLVGTLVDLTAALVSLCAVQAAVTLVGALHEMPMPSALIGSWTVVKCVYSFTWLAVVVVVCNSKELLGVQLFGGPVWWCVVGARAFPLLLAEGVFSPLGCTRGNPLRRLAAELEHAQFTTGSAPGDADVVSWRHTHQPLSRVIPYTLIWGVILAVKSVFDLQILTQQLRLVASVRTATLVYAPFWSLTVFGFPHALLLVGSWLVTCTLFLLDSHVAFSLVLPAIGYCLLVRDGVGLLASPADVKASFKNGRGWKNPTPLAAQFVKVCLPDLSGRGEEAAAATFRVAWDAFVFNLREQDLISNAEQCKLLYGSAVVGVPAGLPLFMHAGAIHRVLSRTPAISGAAFLVEDDAALLDVAFGGGGWGCLRGGGRDTIAEGAVTEVLSSLPLILAHVCTSHSAIGVGDPHVRATVRELFSLAPGETLRDLVATSLGRCEDPGATLARLSSSASALCVEFERDGASSQMRGSPLVSHAIALLVGVHALRFSDVSPISDDGGGAAPMARGRHRHRGGASLYGPSLDAIVSTAELSPATGSPAGGSPARSSIGSLGSPDGSPLVGGDTRSLAGVVALLRTQNDGSGRLDGEGDFRRGNEYASLREAARRCYFLLEMTQGDAMLAVPEAERRLCFFLGSLYMPALPVSPSPLLCPSFTPITPLYNEAVTYRKDFLTSPNASGVTPMLFLKTTHAEEWANLMERLGVRTEVEAWRATAAPDGTPISGELELRLWSSLRGQTLARTVVGVMEAGRALRTLFSLQIEAEFAALDAVEGGGDRPPGGLQEDAAQAALWYTRERFQYIVAAQRYGEHGDDDLKRRSELDLLVRARGGWAGCARILCFRTMHMPTHPHPPPLSSSSGTRC